MGKLNKDVTRERERIAWELRQKCWTQQAIADHLGVQQATVSLILRRVRRRVLEQLQADVEQVKGEQTEQLAYIAAEAMAAWLRSQKPAKKVVRKAEGDEAVITSEIKERDGDPKFLAEARNALAAIRDIWGIDAPKKIDASLDGTAKDALADAEAADAKFDEKSTNSD